LLLDDRLIETFISACKGSVQLAKIRYEKYTAMMLNVYKFLPKPSADNPFWGIQQQPFHDRMQV